jgi:arsenate reductase
MIELIEYPKCSTCKKAKTWLEEHHIEFHDRDITTETPIKEELKTYLKISQYPIKKFFNTSGNLYKKFALKDKLDTMSEDEKLELLSQHGMLIKRPLVVSDSFILVGFREKEWNELLCEKNML